MHPRFTASSCTACTPLVLLASLAGSPAQAGSLIGVYFDAAPTLSTSISPDCGPPSEVVLPVGPWTLVTGTAGVSIEQSGPSGVDTWGMLTIDVPAPNQPITVRLQTEINNPFPAIDASVTPLILSMLIDMPNPVKYYEISWNWEYTVLSGDTPDLYGWWGLGWVAAYIGTPPDEWWKPYSGATGVTKGSFLQPFELMPFTINLSHYQGENHSGHAIADLIITIKVSDVPFPADVSEDINGDGIVDGADLADLMSSWGTANPLADLNGDGVVDGSDLGKLLGAWGTAG